MMDKIDSILWIVSIGFLIHFCCVKMILSSFINRFNSLERRLNSIENRLEKIEECLEEEEY